LVPVVLKVHVVKMGMMVFQDQKVKMVMLVLTASAVTLVIQDLKVLPDQKDLMATKELKVFLASVVPLEKEVILETEETLEMTVRTVPVGPMVMMDIKAYQVIKVPPVNQDRTVIPAILGFLAQEAHKVKEVILVNKDLRELLVTMEKTVKRVHQALKVNKVTKVPVVQKALTGQWVRMVRMAPLALQALKVFLDLTVLLALMVMPELLVLMVTMELMVLMDTQALQATTDPQVLAVLKANQETMALMVSLEPRVQMVHQEPLDAEVKTARKEMLDDPVLVVPLVTTVSQVVTVLLEDMVLLGLKVNLVSTDLRVPRVLLVLLVLLAKTA